eukprot:TRINITY_DN782_c0_g4_i2.p1 TRINITY_DN782_c0_g4~~TRINITY_DN782_c0_g4_i2.p1  ORF type:complete len:343 (-),score=80.52 TRINITY_DN782_c0_g4_i2:75-1103(-)
MKGLLALALLSVLLLNVVADNEQGRLFRMFFQGLTEGIGFPVSYQFFVDNQVDEQDTNVDALFAGLQQLSTFNSSDIQSSVPALNTVGYWLSYFANKRPGVVAKSTNLNETIILTSFSFADAATFLRDAVRKSYDADLVVIGQATPIHMAFVGQQLGLIIANCFGTTVASFLRGIGAGLGYPLNKQYLVDKRFDNSTVNMTDVASILSILRSNPYGPVKTVQAVLVQFNYDIQSIPRTRPGEISSDSNLSQIFKVIFPIVFKDIQQTMNVIQSNGYLDKFPQIADAIPTDIEQAGARLGWVLKLIYGNLTSQASSRPSTSLKELIKLSKSILNPEVSEDASN